MPLVLDAYEPLMADAVRSFWGGRLQARESQTERGVIDQGRRSEVTSGKNLRGFEHMVARLAADNGAPRQSIQFETKKDRSVPGYFRAAKDWDMIIVKGQQLVAAIEFKSQVGPSFGNNGNNRTEEALGNAYDLLTAHREGVFGDSPKPFLGYFFVLEDCEKSTKSVRTVKGKFDIFPEFEGASYAERYEILCRKLVQEQLYDSAALIMTADDSVETGEFRCLSDITSGNQFAKMFAGRIASVFA